MEKEIRLTDRNVEVLAFIVRWKEQHDGNSPNIREIRDGVGLASTSTVAHHIDRMLAAGVLKRNPEFRGPLEVVGGRWRPGDNAAHLVWPHTSGGS